MFKKIFQESIYEIVHNTKLIKIAFRMWLMHNIFLFWDIIYYVNNTLYYKYHIVNKGSFEIFNEVLNKIISWWYSVELFTFWIIFFIWFVILYPLWVALMTFLLEKKKIMRAKAFENYFTIVVVNSWLSLFTLSWLHIMNFFRIWVMDISNNILIKIIIWIILTILIVASILTPFVIYSALLEKSDSNKPEVKFWNAISHSAYLTWWNLWLTIKFTILQILLYFRIFLNLFVVIGIPSAIWYWLYHFGLFELNIIWVIIWVIWFVLLLFILYVDAMINAFFFTFWYKLYKVLIWRNSDD